MNAHTDSEKIKQSYCQAVAEAWNADPLLTVSEWADTYRVLPSKGAAEPGPYRTARTPYMREIMDCLSATSSVQDVTFMAGAQIGKSEGGNNWVGYVMDYAPGPMLLVEPTVDNAKRYSKQRISPMILECDRLSTKVIDNKSRDSSNTMLEKEFPGGILLMGGANSAAGLRSMPIRYLFADEISNWPFDVDGEGDPLELATARTTTFARRKIYKCSTPSVRGSCRIENEYLKTDQRKYFLPCPHCGEFHVLQWSNFVIPKDQTGRYLTARSHMVCPDCGGVIEEHHKTAMLDGGQWRATAPADEQVDARVRGYQINALYSPVGWLSWAAIAKKWIAAQGNAMKLQAFVNNVLAETWSVAGERVSTDSLHERAEDYSADPLPAAAVVLTAGVDVQMDRIEMEVVGWGVGEESWSLEYLVFYGDTQGTQVWSELDLALSKAYKHPAGISLQIARAAVDTGGGEGVTQTVYDYVKKRFGVLPVIGIKGMGTEGKPVIGNPTRSNLANIPLFPVGTMTAKDVIFARLKIEEAGPGFCHFPKRYGLNYFEMLTNEEVRTKLVKGFSQRYYHKLGRNEALDCRVYAFAALQSLNINLEQVQAIIDGSWQADAAHSRRVRGQMDGGTTVVSL